MAISATQYQLQPKETITAYNQRIAGLRGDSSAQLASAQQSAQTYATSSQPNAGALSSRLGSSTPQVNTPTQGATPSFGSGQYSPYQMPTSNSDQYFKQLLGNMKPSAEENNLYGQQGALDAQMRNLSTGQGVMNRKIADQPIEMDFITGQQKAVEERYGLQRQDVQNQQQTLQQKLANLQRNRQSSIDVAKLGVDYGQNQDNRAFQIAQYNNQLGQQQYGNTTDASQYKDQLAQQGMTNALNQQKFTASTAPKATATPTGGASYSPTQSGGGFNPITAKYTDVVSKIQQIFPSDPYQGTQLSTKITSSLTQEQLGLFLNDYLATVDAYDQGIIGGFPDPAKYFEQWSAGAKGSTGGGSSAQTS